MLPTKPHPSLAGTNVADLGVKPLINSG